MMIHGISYPIIWSGDYFALGFKSFVSHDVTYRIDITSSIKIDKPVVTIFRNVTKRRTQNVISTYYKYHMINTI